MRGNKVIVRAYGDNPLLRRVWDVEDGTVYICSDRNFEWLTLNDSRGSYIGFPKDDVFLFDEKYGDLEKLGKEIPELWQHLTKWSESLEDIDEDTSPSEIVDIEVVELEGSEEDF